MYSIFSKVISNIFVIFIIVVISFSEIDNLFYATIQHFLSPLLTTISFICLIRKKFISNLIKIQIIHYQMGFYVEHKYQNQITLNTF